MSFDHSSINDLRVLLANACTSICIHPFMMKIDNEVLNIEHIGSASLAMHWNWLFIFTDADSFQLVPPTISQHELCDDQIWSTVLKTRSSGVHTPAHNSGYIQSTVVITPSYTMYILSPLFPLFLSLMLVLSASVDVYVCVRVCVCVLFSVCMYPNIHCASCKNGPQ